MRMSNLTNSIPIALEGLVRGLHKRERETEEEREREKNGGRKAKKEERNGIRTRKQEVKLPVFTGNMIV